MIIRLQVSDIPNGAVAKASSDELEKAAKAALVLYETFRCSEVDTDEVEHTVARRNEVRVGVFYDGRFIEVTLDEGDTPAAIVCAIREEIDASAVS
jgi:hypothetical protein